MCQAHGSNAKPAVHTDAAAASINGTHPKGRPDYPRWCYICNRELDYDDYPPCWCPYCGTYNP